MKSVRVLRLGCDVGNRRVVAIRLAKQDLIGHRVAGVRVPGFAAKVPDQKHVFVTAGYGTFRNTGQFATKPGGRFASNDYVTAAVTPDGALGMAYLPQGGTITVDLRKLKHNVTARWFDPSANTFQAIAGRRSHLRQSYGGQAEAMARQAGSPLANTGTQQFTAPGKNSSGEPDWVLLLETAPK